MILFVFIGIFTLYLSLLIKKRKNALNFFKMRGIDGPTPNFFFGNFRELIKNTGDQIHVWNKVYGKNRMFGIFLGAKPMLVSTDLDFASKVLIKEFPNFVNRGDLQPFNTIHPSTRSMLMVAELQQWKSLRNYMTPSFSTAKLRASVPLMEIGCQDFIRLCDKMCAKNEEFDMYPAWKCFTIDNISRVAFGMKSHTLENPEDVNPVIKRCYNLIHETFTTLKHQLAHAFPIVVLVMRNVIDVLHQFGFAQHPLDELIEYLKQMIECRRKNYVTANDFMASLLKAEAFTTSNYADFTISDNPDENGSSSIAHSSVGTRMPEISPETVAANTLLFLVAGFETTSSALGHLTNRLAENDNIQEKLRKKIIEAVKSNGGEITYDVVINIPYLSQVINEGLRIDPPVITFTTRNAVTDFEFKGQHYPKGLSIMFPTVEIHHDSEYFPNPEQFDPDRFSPERRSDIPSMAFQPFGDGPRNCIGMRVALTQIKLVLCHLLTEYRILPGSQRGVPTSRGVIFSQPTTVSVRLEKL